jgi:hypothetical protein
MEKAKENYFVSNSIKRLDYDRTGSLSSSDSGGALLARRSADYGQCAGAKPQVVNRIILPYIIAFAKFICASIGTVSVG